jgi:hypothetical protein
MISLLIPCSVFRRLTADYRFSQLKQRIVGRGGRIQVGKARFFPVFSRLSGKSAETGSQQTAPTANKQKRPRKGPLLFIGNSSSLPISLL